MEKHGKRSHTNESQATKSQIKREWENKCLIKNLMK